MYVFGISKEFLILLSNFFFHPRVPPLVFDCIGNKYTVLTFYERCECKYWGFFSRTPCIMWWTLKHFLYSSLLPNCILELAKYVNMHPYQYSTYFKYIWCTNVNCSVIKSSLFLWVIWYSMASTFIISKMLLFKGAYGNHL